MMRNREDIWFYWFWRCTTLEGLPKANVSCLAVIQVYTIFLLLDNRELGEMKSAFIRELGNACFLSQQHEWCSGLPHASTSHFTEQNSTLFLCYQCSSKKQSYLWCYINILFSCFFFPVDRNIQGTFLYIIRFPCALLQFLKIVFLLCNFSLTSFYVKDSEEE